VKRDNIDGYYGKIASDPNDASNKIRKLLSKESIYWLNQY